MRSFINIYKSWFVISSIVFVFANACKKDFDYTNSPINLSFSTDSVLFDTVFTTIGSSTQYLKVYNKSDKDVKIDEIALGGGTNSFFRININGTPAVSLNDVILHSKDSLYIFVEVTVDPNNQNNPLIVRDSIIFNTNGNIQNVRLEAWGQDAHFILPDTHIQGLPAFSIIAHENEDITWENDKPYVIYGYAVIDSTAILRISAGVKIHLHAGAGIWVYKGGSIKVMGTIDEPVVFQGDRLENYYQDVPGQWDRIWINEGSIDNEFNYAVIRNGFIGIQVENLQEDMGNSLIINNTRIENMTGMGIYAKNKKMQVNNVVISNCKEYALALTLGGDYVFRHCTFANYWQNSVRNKPVLLINDYYYDFNTNITYLADLVNAYFGNCIVYGSNAEELTIENTSSEVAFNYLFENSLIKSTLSANAQFRHCYFNQEPEFNDIEKNDFHLIPGSYPIDKGKDSIALLVPYDLEQNSRGELPDLGAYEYLE